MFLAYLRVILSPKCLNKSLCIRFRYLVFDVSVCVWIVGHIDIHLARVRNFQHERIGNLHSGM